MILRRQYTVTIVFEESRPCGPYPDETLSALSEASAEGAFERLGVRKAISGRPLTQLFQECCQASSKKGPGHGMMSPLQCRQADRQAWPLD